MLVPEFAESQELTLCMASVSGKMNEASAETSSWPGWTGGYKYQGQNHITA